jgi:hypothetical protein
MNFICTSVIIKDPRTVVHRSMEVQNSCIRIQVGKVIPVQAVEALRVARG